MQAIISVGGKQHQVTPGQVVRVEQLKGARGDIVEFQRVLAVEKDKLQLGTPLVEGAKVRAEILDHGRADKVRVLKYKRKKQYRKMTGHRQSYTEVRISEILA
ncbi:MAG: 50S ribosomal protein L21 [Acidobacteria bacterium]|nr:50S ribosomal protein L21 [Acidobacteriota bacterium]